MAAVNNSLSRIGKLTEKQDIQIIKDVRGGIKRDTWSNLEDTKSQVTTGPKEEVSRKHLKIAELEEMVPEGFDLPLYSNPAISVQIYKKAPCKNTSPPSYLFSKDTDYTSCFILVVLNAQISKFLTL